MLPVEKKVIAYPWGNSFDSTLANHCDVNCEEYWADQEADDGYTFSAPVGTYPGSESWVGAVDMVGNVFEWVVDWFGEYSDEELTNPTGLGTGTYKVLRGGSYFYEQSRLRTSFQGQYRSYRAGQYNRVQVCCCSVNFNALELE